MLRGTGLAAGSAVIGMVAVTLLCGSAAWGAAGDYEISAASYIGGGADEDRVVGCAIQSSGTAVLAVNISMPPKARYEPRLMAATPFDTTGAYLVRLSGDGRRVLSARRLGEVILDLAIDDADNIYVALWGQGAAKLDPLGQTTQWSSRDMPAQRIDAGPAGFCAVLGGGSDPYDRGSDVRIYEPNGALMGSVTSSKWKYDVCIDEASQTVIYTGFRNAHTSGNPVQIAYIRGVGYDGQTDHGTVHKGRSGSMDRLYGPGPLGTGGSTGYRASKCVWNGTVYRRSWISPGGDAYRLCGGSNGRGHE